MAPPTRPFRLRDVIVFESHPSVRAALVRRLESEEGLVVIQAFAEPDAFAAAVERFTPAFAVVGMFGPFGSHAANRAVERATRTHVVAVVPYNEPLGSTGLDDRVTVVEDGPRGHHLADLVMGRN